MRPTSAMRRFAKRQHPKAVAGTPRITQSSYTRARAQVTAVTTTKGTCTVKLSGVTVPAHYYTTRTAPTVGKTVEVEIIGGGRVIVAGMLK